MLLIGSNEELWLHEPDTVSTVTSLNTAVNQQFSTEGCKHSTKSTGKSYQVEIQMTESRHRISCSDLLHVLHTSALGKYFKTHKPSFRRKHLDTFPARRNSILVLTVITENSSLEQQWVSYQTDCLLTIRKCPIDTQALQISPLLSRN